MDDYGADTYGERIADRYDELHAGAVTPTGTVDDAVSFLADLTGDGRALELGIGTGRVALPLAAAGVEVHGLDSSPRMVAKMREKPGGDAIGVTMGDFTDIEVDGTFELIYVVFNTFFSLTEQEAQVRCMASVAEHLAPGGAFVVEAFVPDLTRYNRDQRVEVRRLGVDTVFLEAARHDIAAQRVDVQQIHLGGESGVDLRPVSLRYAWPSELDLMARLAGLTLADRYEHWSRHPFTAASPFHISVYRPTPDR